MASAQCIIVHIYLWTGSKYKYLCFIFLEQLSSNLLLLFLFLRVKQISWVRTKIYNWSGVAETQHFFFLVRPNIKSLFQNFWICQLWLNPHVLWIWPFISLYLLICQPHFDIQSHCTRRKIKTLLQYFTNPLPLFSNN
jgi:hypothetical protein